MVPNLYATFAHSEHALGNYLTLQNGKSSLTAKEREVINLVVSQVNECAYCLAAHTVLGGMVGFTPEQIIAIRKVALPLTPAWMRWPAWSRAPPNTAAMPHPRWWTPSSRQAIRRATWSTS
jgi:AhpD family alkylhydroperoxidase